MGAQRFPGLRELANPAGTVVSLEEGAGWLHGGMENRNHLAGNTNSRRRLSG